MKLFVELNSNDEVVGFTYAYDDKPSTNTCVEVLTFDGIFYGMRHTNGHWEDTAISLEERKEVARAERNMKLATEVDTTAGNLLRWNALTPEQQAALAAYRQALLDVTAQPGFPHEINWPQAPEL